MATLLYRLGHYSYRHAWKVIGVWLVLLAAVVGAGLALGGQTQESFNIPGTESQDAIDHLGAVFPEAAGGSAQIVYQAPQGDSIRDSRYRNAIESIATHLDSVSGVASALDPYSEYASDAISANGRSAITTVQFTTESSEVPDATLAQVKATASTAEAAGLRVGFGGQVFQDTEFGITITEAFGVAFAAVVLIVTFGSLLAAGMPLISALMGVGITMGLVIGAARFMAVSSASPMLALMLGLAVGIDYSLFILSRHRQQLAHGIDPEESTATAVATAGSAVIFAGITVIIALLGLLVVGIPFLSVMGVAAAIAVFISMAVAVTLVPAMLGLAGGRLVPKTGSRAYRRAHAERSEGGKGSLGARWVRLVLKAPAVAVVGVVLLLGTLAIPALSLDLNLPTGASEPAGSTAREAYDVIAEDFGPGRNGPLIVTVDITQTTAIMEDLDAIGAELRSLPDVVGVSKAIPNPSLDTAIIQITPASGPDSTETKELVAAIRHLAPNIESNYHTPIAVTGATAIAVDISNRLADALVPFILVVVGLSIILLMMVFRSVFVPIKAAVGFLLSIFASIGVVVAIFQWGWLSDLLNVGTPGPILSFLPIIMMALLFGLAMDYEVFLVSGMREEFVSSGDAERAIKHGFSNAARVVTAAALIMFFVFFAFVPEGSGVIKGIALGLAVGIFFDAFLVRMTFVPAAMALMGSSAWWLPKWLGRLLPNVDIEGEQLRHHLADTVWAGQQTAAISARQLVVNSGRQVPIDLDVPTGGVLLLRGSGPDRIMLEATLGGRLNPVAGQAQVVGFPLPGDSRKAMRVVALAQSELAAHNASLFDADRTVGALIAERSALSMPWYRTSPARATVPAWIEKISLALHVNLALDTPLGSLGPVERAVCLTAAALAERPRVVILDLPDGLPKDELGRLVNAVDALAEPATTIVIGVPDDDASLGLGLGSARALIECDLQRATAQREIQQHQLEQHQIEQHQIAQPDRAPSLTTHDRHSRDGKDMFQ